MKLLVEGDHFGEISMVYGCERSTSIISRNYNTMARLGYARFRMINTDYSILEKMMKKALFKYTDPRITFIKSVLKKVEYMKQLCNEAQ